MYVRMYIHFLQQQQNRTHSFASRLMCAMAVPTLRIRTVFVEVYYIEQQSNKVGIEMVWVCGVGGDDIHQNQLIYVGTYVHMFVSWCGGELRADQRKKCADICDVAQVTDICTLPN